MPPQSPLSEVMGTVATFSTPSGAGESPTILNTAGDRSWGEPPGSGEAGALAQAGALAPAGGRGGGGTPSWTGPAPRTLRRGGAPTKFDGEAGADVTRAVPPRAEPQFITNRLLARRQFVVDVLHPGRANVPKDELREKIGKMYSMSEPKTIVLYGFRTQFGGGKSSGFCKLYDSIEAVKQFECRYMVARQDIAEHKRYPRKNQKERKNRTKKLRGRKKAQG